uniref:Uncharacterized protein n=1 Tax=Arundo donax TaxID=35708 RepID=A0A0A9GXN9_ARUDO
MSRLSFVPPASSSE